MRRALNGLLALGFLAIVASARNAAAEPTARACIDAHAAGQIARKSGHLVESTEQFVLCASSACPELIRGECAAFQSEVEAAQPTVVLSVVGPSGLELPDARVSVDGHDWGAVVANVAVPLDPGAHEFGFTLPDGSQRVIRTELREAQKNRAIRAEFSAPNDSAPAPAAARQQTWLRAKAPWLIGGVGVAALGSFAYFGLHGRTLQTRLDRCAPNCQRPDVERMRREYLVADISLGVGLVALAGALYLQLAEHPAPSDASPAQAGTARLDFDASANRFTFGTTVSF